MRILGIGDPCPCCGAPIQDNLPRWKLLLLSYIAEGLSLMDAISAMADVMEFPPPDATLDRRAERKAGEQERYANNIDNSPENPERTPDRIVGGQSLAEEKRAIAQRLRDYRAAHGLGCLGTVAGKTAHRKGSRLPVDTLRDIAAGEAPKMELSEWRKIARALDLLEKEALDG